MNVPGIAPPAFMIPKTDPACEGAMSCGFATIPKVCIPDPNKQTAINISAGLKDLVWPTNNFHGCKTKIYYKLLCWFFYWSTTRTNRFKKSTEKANQISSNKTDKENWWRYKKMKTWKKKKNVESIMIINFLTNDNEAYHLGNHAYTLKYLSGRSHRVTFGQQPLGQVTSGYGARNHQDPRHNIKNPTFRLRKIVVKIGRQPKVVKKRSAILAIAEEKWFYI